MFMSMFFFFCFFSQASCKVAHIIHRSFKVHVGVSAHRLYSWEGSPCQGEVGKYVKAAEKGKKRGMCCPLLVRPFKNHRFSFKMQVTFCSNSRFYSLWEYFYGTAGVWWDFPSQGDFCFRYRYKKVIFDDLVMLEFAIYFFFYPKVQINGTAVLKLSVLLQKYWREIFVLYFVLWISVMIVWFCFEKRSVKL